MLTFLAGKNESGKTAILQSLRRLNPVEESEQLFDHTMEFPRSGPVGLRRRSEMPVLTTTWELDDSDVAVVAAELGEGVLASRTITVSKGYGSRKTTWDVSLDEEKVIEAAIRRGDELIPTAADCPPQT